MNAPDTTLALDALIHERAAALNDKLIAIRRDLHANPELGNREFRTAKVIADHLKTLAISTTSRKRSPTPAW